MNNDDQPSQSHAVVDEVSCASVPTLMMASEAFARVSTPGFEPPHSAPAIFENGHGQGSSVSSDHSTEPSPMAGFSTSGTTPYVVPNGEITTTGYISGAAVPEMGVHQSPGMAGDGNYGVAAMQAVAPVHDQQQQQYLAAAPGNVVVVEQPQVNSSINGFNIDPDSVNGVIGFLKTVGLKDTVLAFTRELGLTPLDSAEAGPSTAESSPSVDYNAIFREFRRLAAYCRDASERLRSQLATLFFPIFAHLYIEIIKSGEFEIGKKFWALNSYDVPPAYFTRMDHLKCYGATGKCEKNEYVKQLLSSKYMVPLTDECHKHFDKFLTDSPIIAKVVNDYLRLEIVSDSKRTAASIAPQLGVLSDATSEKRQKVFNGVLRDDLIVMPSDKKKKKDSKDHKKKDTNAPPVDRIELAPLLDYVVEERKTSYREAMKKGKVSGDNPPSICMYTVLNTNGAATAFKLSENSKLLALGLRDGRVFCKNVAEESLKRIKYSEQLNLSELDMDDIDSDIFIDAGTVEHTFFSHTRPVTGLAFSPDRRLLYSSSLDCTVRIHAMDLLKEACIYRHASPVVNMSLCNRGVYFATSTMDSAVNLWVSEKVAPVRLWSDAFGVNLGLDYHPNCNYVVGGSSDGVVRMWDVLSSNCVRTFTGHRGAVHTVKVSPDGRHLVSVGTDGIFVWDIGQQKLVTVQHTQSSPCKVPVEFTRDGAVVAVGCPYTGISFYSMDSLFSGDVSNDVAFDPDGFFFHQYFTKKTPISEIQFLKRNVVLCVGAYPASSSQSTTR